MKTTTIILAGVGGQGTILAADVLARCAIASGYDTKVSEIHGMSQRGGAVSTVVRFGEKVNSMVAPAGYADMVIALETTEALRNVPFLAEGGSLYASDETIKPLPVLRGMMFMPENPAARIEAVGGHVVPAVKLATEAGTPKASNIALLGALSKELPFEYETWKTVIAHRVPARFVDANMAAFEAGRAFSQNI